MTTEQKLLPCQCGNAEVGVVGTPGCWWGECRKCGSVSGPHHDGEKAREVWNVTRATQHQAVEGLPERMDIPSRDEYELDCHWAAAVEQAKAHNDCHDAFMPHVNAMAARIAELVAENDLLKRCRKTEIEAGDSWKKEAQELEAQLAKGKEGLPDYKSQHSPFDYAAGRNDAIDECQAAFAVVRAENEILQEALQKQVAASGEYCNQLGTLRVNLDEGLGLLRQVRHDTYLQDIYLGKPLENNIDAFLAKHGTK